MSESNTNSKTGRGSATSGLVDTNQTATCTYNKEPYMNHIHLQSIKYHLQQNCISNLFLLQFLTYPYTVRQSSKILRTISYHYTSRVILPSVVVSGPRNKCCRTKQRPHQTGKGPRGQAPVNVNTYVKFLYWYCSILAKENKIKLRSEGY